MQIGEPNDEMLYYFEILRAKLEIKDYYLKNIVREIYENTGQVLSLVRVQLDTIKRQVEDNLKDPISDSGKLVGQGINDWRNMSRNFFPEKEILSEYGLMQALKMALMVEQEDNSGKKVKTKGIPFALKSGSGLIFIWAILEIISLIIKSYGQDSIKLEIIYTNTKLNIRINYSGPNVDLTMIQGTTAEFPGMVRLSVYDRLKLIGGELTVEKTTSKKTRTDISIPYLK